MFLEARDIDLDTHTRLLSGLLRHSSDRCLRYKDYIRLSTYINSGRIK